MPNYFDHSLLVLLGRIARTTYVDAAYFYRPSIAWAVSRSVILVSPAKTAEPIEMSFALRTRIGPGKHVLGGSRSLHQQSQFEGEREAHCKEQRRSTVSAAKRLNRSRWSPSTLSDIDSLESVQRRFTKRLSGLHSLSSEARLKRLKLQSLELRSLLADVVWCYKITFGLVTFCVSRRRRKSIVVTRVCVSVSVCVCVCLSVRGHTPTLLHGPGCNLGEW